MHCRKLHWLRAVSILAAVLPAFLTGWAAAVDLSAPPLERKVSVNVWGARLSDLIREAGSQTGVEILLYPPDFPAEAEAADLYLVSGGAPLGAVLECLAKRFSFRYRVAQSGRIEISRSYGWADADPALRFPRLDAVIPPGGADALSRQLREFTKPLALLNGEYRLVFEKSPLPDKPDSVRAVIAMPPVLADYLEKGIACLSGYSGDYPPSEAGGRTLFATARRDSPDWQAFLDRQVAVPGSGSLRAVLGGICDQAAVVVALAGPPAAASADLTGLSGGTVGFGRITDELAKRCGLGKRVFLAGGALVFEAGSPGDWEMDSRSRELYWSGLAVAGLDAANAAARLGDGANLLNLARTRVFPELWRDPACSMVYSNVSGRLAVVAPLNAVEALADFLRNQAP